MQDVLTLKYKYNNGASDCYAPVTGVSLNKTSTALTVGDSETLTAALKPEYALHPDLVWESNDPSVATVSENGVVTAVAAGKATITVTATNGTEDTSDDKTATCEVTVKTTVKVTAPAGKTFTYNGKTQTGVAAGDNYALTGTTKAAEAGSYTAKATLKTSTDFESASSGSVGVWISVPSTARIRRSFSFLAGEISSIRVLKPISKSLKTSAFNLLCICTTADEDT